MKYLITGASSGIGKRLAERLLENGNECILIARNMEKLNSLASKYKLAFPIYADLKETESIEEIFRTSGDLFPVDGIIHCAGVAPLCRIDENDVKTVKETYATNLFSFIELMRCAVEYKSLNSGASIVAMSSVAGQRSSNRQSIYSGTKAALDATIRCMARELLNQNIRLNTVVSGTVETEMLQSLREKSPNLDEKIKYHYPLGIIPIDEVCDMIEFLLSDKSAHISGATMPVDSGYFL